MRGRAILAVARLAVAWLVLAAGAARAQTTSTLFGDVIDARTGKPIVGAVLVLRSPQLPGEQAEATDENGRYRATLIPLGIYRIHVEATGYRAVDQGEIIVPLGTAIRVNVALVPAVHAAKVIRVSTRQSATVDQGSTTFGVVLEREFLESIPLADSRLSTALSVSPASIGIEFAGSSLGENTNLVDGMNTTDIAFGGGFPSIARAFVDQVQVKVGGYMPEFGRATGGIVSSVIRSGGNDFHGELYTLYEAGWLETFPETVSRGAITTRFYNKLFSFTGVTLGGPVVKDKLWFFVGLEPYVKLQDRNRFIFRQFEDPQRPGSYLLGPDREPVREQVARQINRDLTLRLRFASKLTWAPGPTQRLALSFFGQQVYRDFVGGGGNSELSRNVVGISAGIQTLVLNYQGKFFDKRFQVEATAGYRRRHELWDARVRSPRISFAGGSIQLPEPLCRQDPSMSIPTCPTGFGYGLGDVFWVKQLKQRGSVALKASLFLRRHQIKIGADMEWNADAEIAISPGGQDEVWRYRPRSDLDGDGVPDRALERLIIERGFLRVGAAGEIIRHKTPPRYPAFSRNFGAFLQDSWSVFSNLTFNFGLRYEAQQLYGAEGPATLEHLGDPTSRILNTVLTLNKNFAPRTGIIWDPFNDGRTKIFGSFGVYYESVPLGPAHVGFSRENPALLRVEDLRGNILVPSRTLSGGVVGVQDDLSPQYIYEWIAGIEHELWPGYRIGLTFLKRTFGSVIEDLSVDEGGRYFFGNPGTGPTGALEIARLMANPGLELDSRCAQPDLDDIRTVKCTGDFPPAVRDYDSWTFSFEKRLTADQPWQIKFFYTLSFLSGNHNGLAGGVPNLTQRFDLISLLPNSLGWLNGDHRHNIKLYGSYNFRRAGLPGLTIGLGLQVLSGSPLSALGAHEPYGQTFILPRGTTGRLPWLTQADIHVEYKWRLGKQLTFSLNATVFNFLNLKEVTSVDDEYTFDSVCPLGPGQPLSALRISDGFDPVTGVCIPSETPATPNPNFGKPTDFQNPIRARLGLKLTF